MALGKWSPEGDSALTSTVKSDPANKPPRLLVTGEDAGGRSRVVSDSIITEWVNRPTGLSVTEVWRADSLPVRVDELATRPGKIIAPATTGVAVRLAVFPPDEEIDAEAMEKYEASMRDLYGDQGGKGSTHIAGMHRTDTIDVVTVVDGEICVLLDDGEALLRTGDCLIQRGTRHAWRNRSGRPCTLVTAVLPAVRG
jgi:mannose-6-phosphate isomerase-like protein (cupin superfamily)